MKNIITIILIIICLTSFRDNEFITKSTNYYNPYDLLAGTWQYKNGNEIFIVYLWRVADGYKGHYKKIIVDASSNQVTEVYNSDKPIGNTTINWPYSIYTGNLSQNYSIGGTIDDNTVINPSNGGGFVEGKVTIKVLNPSCYNPTGNTCTVQAQWTVKKMSGLIDPNEPDFSVPKNIILTKQ